MIAFPPENPTWKMSRRALFLKVGGIARKSRCSGVRRQSDLRAATALFGGKSASLWEEHLLTAEAGVVFAAQCVEAHPQFGDRESGAGLWIHGCEAHEFLQIDDFPIQRLVQWVMRPSCPVGHGKTFHSLEFPRVVGDEGGV